MYCGHLCLVTLCHVSGITRVLGTLGRSNEVYLPPDFLTGTQGPRIRRYAIE